MEFKGSYFPYDRQLVISTCKVHIERRKLRREQEKQKEIKQFCENYISSWTGKWKKRETPLSEIEGEKEMFKFYDQPNFWRFPDYSYVTWGDYQNILTAATHCKNDTIYLSTEDANLLF